MCDKLDILIAAAPVFTIEKSEIAKNILNKKAPTASTLAATTSTL